VNPPVPSVLPKEAWQSRWEIADRPKELFALGNQALLNQSALALFCSSRCPGSIILKACDAVKGLRDEGRAVIGGFHSAIEKECLGILMRGQSSIILCPARSLQGIRLKGEWKKPLEEGRLLILSPFPKKQTRTTAALAQQRNLLVASLADEVLILHTSPNSKTDALCRLLREREKPIWAINDSANEHLFAMGLSPWGDYS
jgi:predicted Rossmann fold nucleotide-binding protein DprA/Smf involved in DNA uptake